MENENKKNITHRSFFRIAGTAGAVTAGLTACGGRNKNTTAGTNSEIPTDKMTYRTNPKTGDKVSLLGFGMMRLPSVGGRSAREGNEETAASRNSAKPIIASAATNVAPIARNE